MSTAYRTLYIIIIEQRSVCNACMTCGSSKTSAAVRDSQGMGYESRCRLWSLIRSPNPERTKQKSSKLGEDKTRQDERPIDPGGRHYLSHLLIIVRQSVITKKGFALDYLA
ncbi:hypothetical protein HD806DRAFT_491690 [Xylariaceae sp. AK1471]|nr:hypothetical protein HD806DRAFT_491690 [Xylariaceae sp. AK1471]